MTVDRWPADFRYISRRLVRQIIQQDQATRSRWRAAISLPTPWGTVTIHKEPHERENDFALCRQATEAVRDHTGTIDQSWEPYIRAELDLTMGYLTVLMGWDDRTHVDIAAMKAEVNDPEDGRVLVALFGSAANYRGRKPVSDGLAEIPSDIDGLYGILDRTREAADPLPSSHYLDRDIGYTPSGRADTAVRLLGDRFKGFHEERLEVLMQCFCTADDIQPYSRVVLGAPVWVATPSPRPFGPSTKPQSTD